MTPLPLLPVALLVGLVSPAVDAPTSNLDASGPGEIRFPSALESARVEVIAGRAIVVGGGLDGLTDRGTYFLYDPFKCGEFGQFNARLAG